MNDCLDDLRLWLELEDDLLINADTRRLKAQRPNLVPFAGEGPTAGRRLSRHSETSSRPSRSTWPPRTTPPGA